MASSWLLADRPTNRLVSWSPNSIPLATGSFQKQDVQQYEGFEPLKQAHIQRCCGFTNLCQQQPRLRTDEGLPAAPPRTTAGVRWGASPVTGTCRRFADYSSTAVSSSSSAAKSIVAVGLRSWYCVGQNATEGPLIVFIFHYSILSFWNLLSPTFFKTEIHDDGHLWWTDIIL